MRIPVFNIERTTFSVHIKRCHADVVC